LEIGDTAGLETCGTVRVRRAPVKIKPASPDEGVPLDPRTVAAGILPAVEPGFPARRKERTLRKSVGTFANLGNIPPQSGRQGCRPPRQARMPDATVAAGILPAVEPGFPARRWTLAKVQGGVAETSSDLRAPHQFY